MWRRDCSTLNGSAPPSPPSPTPRLPAALEGADPRRFVGEEDGQNDGVGWLPDRGGVSAGPRADEGT